jgi:uncharacterized phosphosugar-binding protein
MGECKLGNVLEQFNQISSILNRLETEESEKITLAASKISKVLKNNGIVH